MKRYLLALLSGLVPACAVADKVWLDADWQPTDNRAEATYHLKQELQERDGGWPVAIFYGDTDIPLYVATMRSPELSEANARGAFVAYYRDGRVRAAGANDAHGRRDGRLHFYAQDGRKTIYTLRAGKMHGEQKMFYPSGQLGMHYWYEDDVQVGEERVYRSDGQLQSVTPYVDGEKDGVVEQYHANGQLRMQASYAKGKREGLQRHWDGRGQRVSESYFRNDQQHGESRGYANSESPTSVTQYAAGQKVGEQLFYYQNSDRVRERNIYDAQERPTLEQRFNREGELVWEQRNTYDGDHHQVDRSRFHAGQRLKRYRKDSARNWSLEEEWNAEGKLITRREVLAGNLHGVQVERSGIGSRWYISRVEFRHDERQGVYESHWEDGELQARGRYVNDHKVGRWVWASASSRTVNRYDDDQGELHGEQRITDRDGMLIKREHYHHGVLQGRFEERDHDGKLLAQGNYEQGQRHGAWKLGEEYILRYRLWQGGYRDGKQVGTWQAWSEEGYEVGRRTYDDQGRLHGREYRLQHNGQLESFTDYRHGRKHGEAVEYGAGGEVFNRRIYVDGWRQDG